MVVDDDLTIGRLLVRLFAVHGQTAVAVTSGEEALALFHQDPARYCLVVTDMAMPTMNGAELAAELRSARPELAIVLSSGTDFVLAGTPFDDVLPKPYTAGAVSALLARRGVPARPDETT